MNFEVSILGALLPIFTVILSGFAFKRFNFPGDAFWSYAERLTYFVLFPSLLLLTIATASLESKSVVTIVEAVSLSAVIMAGLLFISRLWWSGDGPAFTSFFQGSIRFNTYVGLSATFALFGNDGLTLAAVAMSALIPILNVVCVSVLVIFGNSKKGNWRTIFIEIVRNPLIIACSAGIALNVSGTGLHPFAEETLALFGRASLPIGLLCVGAGLNIEAARKSGIVITASCALKLLAFPFLMWMVCRTLDLDAVATSIAVLFAALPGSPAAYILARQLGGDSRLMAGIITVQIVLSMVTLPVIMSLIIH